MSVSGSAAGIKPRMNTDNMDEHGSRSVWFESLAVGYVSRRFALRVRESAKRAEKTSKEAAARALPPARAARADGHEIRRCKQRRTLRCLHLWIT